RVSPPPRGVAVVPGPPAPPPGCPRPRGAPPAVTGVVPISMSRRPAPASLPGDHPTAEVRVGVCAGVESRERHEPDKDQRTGEGERNMEAKQAMTPAAVGAAKRPTRGAGGSVCTRAHSVLLGI